MMPRRTVIATCSAVVLVGAAAPAVAGIYGTEPLLISVRPGDAPPNGPSAHPSVSGDNRFGRYTAFDSDASNLVSGDTNEVTDVFVWRRPRGRAGLRLRRPGGVLQRVSVSSRGRQANGPSSRPSVDGSVQTSPHCIAFQSQATNLASGDRDRTSDIYLRELRSDHTTLISKGIDAAATNASIDGSCANVAFEADGNIFIASTHGGVPKRLAAGHDPSYSLDGSAITWVRSGDVWVRRNGVTSRVGPGRNPTVSGNDQRTWAVSFDTTRQLARNDRNRGSDVYMRILGPTGGVRKTDLISATRRGGSSLGGDSYNGGITAYGGTHGIVVFVNHTGHGSDLYYRNNRSGNIDDLAHAPGPITQVASSARANFVAFTSSESFVGNSGRRPSVFIKHLIDGRPLR